MKITDILFVLSAAVTANAMLVSTGSNGSFEASGLIAGFSPRIYKRGRETPFDKDQSDNNGSNQGTTSSKKNQLIRRLERELHEADIAEEVAADAFHRYENLKHRQEMLALKGKAISGEKHSEQRQQELKKEWDAALEKFVLLREKLQTESATPSRDRKHSIDDPGSSTSGRGRKHSVIEPNPCTTKQSRKLPSDKEQPRENRELIRQLVKELEAADAAETAACEASYAYRVIEYEQKRLISQGKPIIGKKHSGIHQCRLGNQWQTAWKKVEHLEQQLQEARLATPSRGRKHSIDDPGSSTSGRGRKHSVIEPNPCTTKQSRKLPSDKEQPRENRELIRQLVKELEAADAAETAACEASYAYRVIEYEQKRLISQGKPIIGKKHSGIHQCRLGNQWQTAWKKVEHLEQQLQEARLATPSRGRKHSIDDPGSSTSGRGRKHSVIEPNPCTTKQSRKLPSDKEQPRENRELIRQLVKELEAADAAETAACEASYAYRVIEYEQKRLISQGKPIIGKKHSGIHQCRLDNQWQTTGKKVEHLEQQLQEARLATPSRGRKHSIDDPGSSTSGRGRKHSVIEPNPCTTKQSRKLPSDKEQPRENRELIRQLVKELEAADAAETAACEASYAYRVIEYEQKRLISQGKPIIGKKHSGIHQCRLDNQWQTTGKKVEHLEQQLQEARLATPSRGRKHSIDDPGSSTSGRGRKHSVIEPNPCTTKQSRKLPSDKEQPRENRELIRQLVKELEAADAAETAACEASYAYRVIEYEQKRLISQGKPIIGKKHSGIHQCRLDNQWQTTGKKVEHLEQQLQEARLATPKQSRKHSIDDPGSSTSGRGRKHSIVRHHSDTDSDQGIAPAKKHRPTHQLDINLENAERARVAACNSYYEYKATRLEQKKLKSNGQKISGKKYSSRTEHELKEKCRKASKAKHYMIRQLEETNGNTPSRSRKHSIVRHHSDTDSDQETLSRKKYRKLVRKLKRKIKEYRRRQKDVCKEYREHQFFVSKQQSRLTRGKSVSKSFYDLEDLEKLERKCKRAGRRVEYLEQKLRKLMGESDSDSD